VCVCVLAEGENSFACPFTLLPFAAQCSGRHWTKRSHCGIQMKQRGGGAVHRQDGGAGWWCWWWGTEVERVRMSGTSREGRR